MSKILFLDTACNAFPVAGQDWEPHCVRIAAIREDDGVVTGTLTRLVNSGCKLADSAQVYHHRATPDDFKREESFPVIVAREIADLSLGVDRIVSHHSRFHRRVLGALLDDGEFFEDRPDPEYYCTMEAAAPICQLNLPRLREAYKFFCPHVPLVEAQDWRGFADQQVAMVQQVYHGIQASHARPDPVYQWRDKLGTTTPNE